MAVCYYHQHNFNSCRFEAQKAVSLNPRNPEFENLYQHVNEIVERNS